MRARSARRRAAWAAGLAGGVALIVAGCAAETGTSGTAETIAELCADSVVAACEETTGQVAVTVAGSATDEETLRLADLLNRLAEEESLDAATLRHEPVETPQLDDELPTPPKWTVAVHPADPAEVESTLTEVLEVADVPGTTGIRIEEGWPTVTVTDMADFEWVFGSVSELPLFADGGTYVLLSSDDHLRMDYLPERVSDLVVQEVIRIAREYPEAEVSFIVDMSTVVPAPSLLVTELTAQEIAAIAGRLTEAQFADADPTGAPLPFRLTETGGNVTEGTFGAVEE